MGNAAILRDVILLALIAHAVIGAAIDFRISASTIEPFDDLPPDFEAATDASEASKSQEMFDNSEDITFISTSEPEIPQVAEFAVPRPSLKEVEELLQRGEIKLNETTHGDQSEEEGQEEVVKISGDVTTTQTPPTTTASTTTTTTATSTAAPTTVTTTTRASTTTTTTVRSTTTTTVRPTTVSTTTTPRTTTVPSTTTTTEPVPTTPQAPNLKIDFRGIPRELLTSEEIEEQERQEDEELQKALKLLPEKEIEKKKLHEETFFAFSEGEESETVQKEEAVPKDELPPSTVIETSKKVLSLNKIFDDEDEVEKREIQEKTEKVEDADMLTVTEAPVTEIVELRTTAPKTTTMVPANLFARNMPQNFEQFTFQVGRNFVPRQIFQKPKDGVSALIDMAIPQLSLTTPPSPASRPLIGKQMVEIDVPVRIPEFATTTPSTTRSTTPATTTAQATTTAAPTTTTTEEPTTPDFKFPFVVPDGIKSEDKKKSIEESLKEIKDAFKRIRQLVKEDGKEDGSEIDSASAEEEFTAPPPPTDPTTVRTTTVRTTRAVTTTVTTPAPTTTTTVPTSTTTVATTTGDIEELINPGVRPSWLDLSVFAENHQGFITTNSSISSTVTASASTTTTTEVPTTTSTEPPPKEALVTQAFAVSEKKKDEMKEALEKKEKELKESEFGGNVFDEIAERGDHDRFSTAAPPPTTTTARPFSPPPVPPLPNASAEIETGSIQLQDILSAEDALIRQVTRRPREQNAPPKAPSLQQERLPQAFRSLVEDLESEAETQRLLMEQLKLEEAQLSTTTTRRPKKRVSRKRITTTTTTTASPAFLDGALTNEVEQFFEDPKEAEEKVRNSGRVIQLNSTVAGPRRRLLKGRRRNNQQKQQGELAKHSRIVRTQKRLVLVPEEEEIGKWVESQERGRHSKLPSAAQPPVKGAGRTTPPPVFSIGDPAKMRTTPGPLLAISITSRPYYNVNSRMHVQQLQPQPDGTIAVRQFELDNPEQVKPQIKERRAIVEPHRQSRPSHSSDPQSARARDRELAMQRIATQIADKMFPTTKPPQQVHPIRPVPLAPPRHTIRIGKKASSSAVPLAVKRTVDSSRVSIDALLDPRTIDPRTVRVRNRRNKHVVGISRRRKYNQGQASHLGAFVLHADPSLPAGAIEVPGLIRGERAIHDGERQIASRAAPIQPPVLHPLVVDRNYDRQTIDRDIRL